jgi:titin
LNPADGTSPVTISGLTNGTSYTLALRAVNAVGRSDASASVTATPATIPSAPTSLSAVAGNGQVQISFTAGNNGGSAITNYEYTLDGGTTWTPLNPVDGTSPVTISGLTNGTSYTLALRAVNAVGVSDASASVTATPVTVPSAPTALLDIPGNGKLEISFVAGNNGGSPITNYEYTLNGGTNWTPFNPADGTSPVTISGLTNGTSYTLALKAVNAVGLSVASASISASPVPDGLSCGTYTNKTTLDGLGTDDVRGIYTIGSTLYVTTGAGLSISTNGGTSFTNKTTADGLGDNFVRAIFAIGSTVYAATEVGLSISTDGGASFTNKTTANGLGNNSVRGVHAIGNTIHAATTSGLSISTNGGTTFTNYTTGLGSIVVNGVYAIGSTIYAATDGGLSISTDGGASFTNQTTANGLGNNRVRGIYAIGNTVYAATDVGLSISTDGGTTFTNKTTTNGLGSNVVRRVFAIGNTVYAATQSGLSISTDGGTSFTNYTTANGLGNDSVYGVYATGSTVYAGTDGGLSFCATVPSAPTSLSAVAGNGQLQISFVTGNNGGSAITNYEYTLDGGTTWIPLNPVDGTSPVTISGLTNGASYTLALRAVNVVGLSVASASVTATPVTVPSAPTSLSAVAGNGQVQISFTAGNNGGSAITNYEYTLDGGTTWTPLNPADATSPVTISGLTNGTSYTLALRGVNAVGLSVASASVTATPVVTVPSAPTALLDIPGNGKLEISFVAGNNGGSAITNYEYTVNGGTTWTPLNPADGTSPVTISGLTNDTSYTLALRAVNAVGVSVTSASITASPLLDGPVCNTYTNKTTANGLGTDDVYGVYAIGTTVYAATYGGGLGISTDGGTSFTNKTTANGLGDNAVNGVYAIGTTVYAATDNGLSISINGGDSFINKTTANGLGNNRIWGVYASGSTVYAATIGGLSISTDGGNSFTNKTTANGLGSNTVNGVYVIGSTVYAATSGGLSISINGGDSFTNKTTTNGLGSNNVVWVYAIGTTVYAATDNGLSISTDGGTSFTNKTTANGLGDNAVNGVYAIGTTVYAATRDGGLSISTDGGTSFTNYTTVNGLGNNRIWGVYASGGTVYAATLIGLSSCMATVPSAPTSLSAVAGNGQLQISFTAGANGGSPITNYEYTLNGGTTWTPLNPVDGTSPVTISGLTNGASYTLALRAVNVVGVSVASASVTATPVTVPSDPTSLSATAGNGQLQISFTAGNNGGSAITNYEYSLNGGTTWSPLNPVDGTSPVTISGLTNGTSYTLALRAVNAVGVSIASASLTAIVVTETSSLTIDAIANQTYTGSAISPIIVVKNGAMILTLGTDYTVAYSNNTNEGTATVTITGLGNYTGTKTETFVIVAKAAITLTIDAIANQTYTGSAITPTVVVKDGSTTLTLGTDYTVAYSSNTNVGTATVTITGTGNYSGTKTQTFGIVAKAASTLTIDAIANQSYTGSAITPTVVVKDGSTTLTLGTDYTVAYSNNTNAGTSTVTITGTGNYLGDNPQTFTIAPKAITIRGNNASKIYGDSNPSLSFSYSGLVAGDTEIDQVPVISTTASTTSGVGNYPITLTGGSDPNYSLTLVEGVLQVSPAPLSLVVNNATKIYGQADPVYTYSLLGLKGSDTDAVLDGAFTRETGEDPGTYRISQGSLSAGANYTLTVTGASLQILKAKVSSVAQLALVTTAWSKEPALPATVKVLAAHGQDFQVEVKWDKSTLNLLARGTYSLTGTLILPAGIENPNQVLAKIQVQVLPKPAPRDVTITNSTFVGSTTAFFIPVGDFVVNDPLDNIHVVSLLGDGYDNTYFEIKNNILFWSSAERAPGKTRFSIVVRVTDRDGNTLDKFFEIKRTRPDFSTVTIFNTFTPNGDRFNDTWGVPEVRFYEGARISVYERGGSRVFYTENPDVRWDGTFEGKELPVDSYYWVIQIRETGEIRRGVLNLIRK